MANSEQDQHESVTPQDISDAYGDLLTFHQQGTLAPPETEQALRAAAIDISRCTVAITTMFEDDDLQNVSFGDLRPGTGVLVKSSGVHGIVTAAHVLRGTDKAKRYQKGRCSIGIMPFQCMRRGSVPQPYFRIRGRQCLAYGVQNRDPTGPDIAYVPLTPREWAMLESDGVRAWTPLDEPAPAMPGNTKAEILFDCCFGTNHKATRRLQEAHPEPHPAIAIHGLQVVELPRERIVVGGWDYTKLTLEGDDKEGSAPAEPRTSPDQTYRDFLDYEWPKLDPQDMLGGFSGTGLWTARVRVNKNGDMSLHTKRLKGIIFYAGPGLDATLHGRQSIRRIITEGIESHGGAAEDEAKALEEAARRRA
ncbi:MAG: hypothetical protein OXU81_09620 [Gammaproteobacteria bacterium]|nr:hypothetical protein [Gammaproteobacteria bacterium]